MQCGGLIHPSSYYRALVSEHSRHSCDSTLAGITSINIIMSCYHYCVFFCVQQWHCIVWDIRVVWQTRRWWMWDNIKSWNSILALTSVYLCMMFHETGKLIKLSIFWEWAFVCCSPGQHVNNCSMEHNLSLKMKYTVSAHAFKARVVFQDSQVKN